MIDNLESCPVYIIILIQLELFELGAELVFLNVNCGEIHTLLIVRQNQHF